RHCAGLRAASAARSRVAALGPPRASRPTRRKDRMGATTIFNVRSARARLAGLLLGVASVGCTVGPDYVRPEVDRPSTLTADTAGVTSDAIRFTTEAPLDRWWEVFRDPALDRLVASAREGNPGLRASLARVQAARAVSRQAFAPLFPTLESTPSYSREKSSR